MATQQTRPESIYSNPNQLKAVDAQTLKEWLDCDRVLLVDVREPAFLFLSGFVGAGLMFAGITDTCAMAMLLAKLPYNQKSA